MGVRDPIRQRGSVMAATKNSTSINWAAIKKEYLSHNLDTTNTEALTLKQLAKKHGLNPGTVRNRSAQEGWTEELSKLQDEKVSVVLSALAGAEGEAEAAIRIRQARVARMGLQVAATRISQLSPADLSPKDAIQLMKISMEQERMAMGFERFYDFAAPQSSRLPDFESVRQNMENHEKAMSMADELRDFLENLPTDIGMRDIDGEVVKKAD